jgi:hypothetical protein
MLLVAYVVLFLPQALGALRTSLLQVDTDVDAAARTLGASRWEVVVRVLLPLSAGGAVAGATLVFLTIVKELPATLLLAPSGFETLATRVWSATEEAFYTRAALPALLLVLVGSLPLAVRWSGRNAVRRSRERGRRGKVTTAAPVMRTRSPRPRRARGPDRERSVVPSSSTTSTSVSWPKKVTCRTTARRRSRVAG